MLKLNRSGQSLMQIKSTEQITFSQIKKQPSVTLR